MGETAGPPSYEELLHTFKAVLNHALRQGELLPTCLSFDLAVVQAIGDVARAAGDGSPTRELVGVACQAFAKYAVEQEAAQRSKSTNCSTSA
jgi:hypothetical protein